MPDPGLEMLGLGELEGNLEAIRRTVIDDIRSVQSAPESWLGIDCRDPKDDSRAAVNPLKFVLFALANAIAVCRSPVVVADQTDRNI